MEPLSIEQYGEAVLKLAKLAQGDTGGSRVAAQVILSAYNGDAWQLDITDLCNLDHDNYRAALKVIRGRTELMVEPHTLLKDGDEIFESLWEQWNRYHISNRWKRTCDLCYGKGEIYEDEMDESNENMLKCDRCNGTGLLEK